MCNCNNQNPVTPEEEFINAVKAVMMAHYKQQLAKRLRERRLAPMKAQALPSAIRLFAALRYVSALVDAEPSRVNSDIKTVVGRAYREASRAERVCRRTR